MPKQKPKQTMDRWLRSRLSDVATIVSVSAECFDGFPCSHSCVVKLKDECGGTEEERVLSARDISRFSHVLCDSGRNHFWWQ